MAAEAGQAIQALASDGYTDAMRSVADDLRAETRAQLTALEPAERLRLAFQLGDADVAALGGARGLTIDEAAAVFSTSRSVGRVPSVANRSTT